MYGKSYEIPSPKYKELNEIFNHECAGYDVMHEPKEIFTYLRSFVQQHAGKIKKA